MCEDSGTQKGILSYDSFACEIVHTQCVKLYTNITVSAINKNNHSSTFDRETTKQNELRHIVVIVINMAATK